MSAAYSMSRRLSPVPDVGEVAGQAAGNQEQRVNPDVVPIPGIARCKPLGGDSDAAQAVLVERHCRRLDATALLDLDEGDDLSAPDDQVDLAAGNARAAG